MSNFPLKLISAVLFVLLAASSSASASETEAPKRISPEYELDAYYSNVGLYISLTDEPIPDVGEKAELAVYRDLFLSSYIPRFLVLEAAVFPMPLAGVAIKNNAEDLYKSAEVSDNLNLIKAVTLGFEEPYAFSVFLGNVIRFRKTDEVYRQGNFGYMGYLISVGDYHIKDNELIYDRWVEIEWKVKGDREFEAHDLHWSFRAGAKLHDNPDIKDVVYIGLRRGRLDYEDSDALLKNTGFEYRYDMDIKDLSPVRHLFIVDKRWPWKKIRVGFSVEAGFIWEAPDRYMGELADTDHRENLQYIIRPNLIF